MLDLSLIKLKLIAKSRSIKFYKSMSENRLLSALNVSESLKKSGKNFDGKKSARNKNCDANEISKTIMSDLKLLQK